MPSGTRFLAGLRLGNRTEREVAMATRAVDGSILFAKKLGGVFAMILGGLIAAIGANVASPVTIAIGVLFVIAGAILLVLKIIRRNEGGQVG
ncbi:MAG TPA: hypothetical protein VKR55_19515 [Bradyrhizobium sp.]|uniref:hypothetical protein n=1 Tax=Bradyrhizobium sp. TaxID=376 RepID=UPI002CF99218|nr:hypothetical protein [Bradyrhizobium sp.]HLZ04322.1 hypothetical protein [Bradyrhizobium sp.]